MAGKKDSIEFIQMTCPKCGGELMISSKLDKAICNYCGNSFLVVKNLEGEKEAAAKYTNLGNIALQSINYEEAYNYYTKALELDPESYMAWLGKAITSYYHPTPDLTPEVFEDTWGWNHEYTKIDEAKSYFDNALLYAPENEKPRIRQISNVKMAELWGNAAQKLEQEYKGIFLNMNLKSDFWGEILQKNPDDYVEDERSATAYYISAHSIIQNFNKYLYDIDEKKEAWLTLNAILPICKKAIYYLSESEKKYPSIPDETKSTEDAGLGEFDNQKLLKMLLLSQKYYDYLLHKFVNNQSSEDDGENLKIIICVACGATNTPESPVCILCGKELSLQAK